MVTRRTFVGLATAGVVGALLPAIPVPTGTRWLLDGKTTAGLGARFGIAAAKLIVQIEIADGSWIDLSESVKTDSVRLTQSVDAPTQLNFSLKNGLAISVKELG